MSALAQGTAVAEREDAPNAVLDLAERAVETAIAVGGEAAIRARLARLLPAPAPVVDGPDALGWAQIVTALRIVANRRLTEADHLAVARTKEIAAAWMDAASRRAR